MNKTLEIFGGLIVGGLLAGSIDYLARKESSKNKLMLESKRMEHERYVMDHPIEFKQYLDADRCIRAENERDENAKEARRYRDLYDKRGDEITRLAKERDDALKKVQTYAERELAGIYRQRGVDFNSVDPSTILNKLAYTFDDDDKRLEAIKVIFGEGEIE